MINIASKKHNVNFKWCDALEAVQICENIKPEYVNIGFEVCEKDKIRIYFNKQIYQKTPFVYTSDFKGIIKRHNLELVWVPNCPYYLQYCILTLSEEYDKLGVACTSMSGNKSVHVKKISEI